MDRVDSTNGISKNESAAKENANIAENLLEKNIKSGFIVLASRVVAIGVELLKTLLLAVFLSPGEFGIVGSAYLIINSIDNFSKIELESALIQKKEDIRAYLDSAWTFTFLKSSGVTGVLILISPLLAAFFNEQRLVLTIVILSLFTVLRDSKNIGVVYLQKSLNFKKIVIGKIITQISSLVLLILSLIAFRNYFAMLIGYISVYALEFITSFIIHPYRPRFKISMKHVKELMKFSKWMFISYILIFLNNEGDDYVVGRIFGLATLAIYQLAYRISCLPATEIAFVISRTVFPSYSIIQDDKEKLRRGFIKNFQVVCFITVPMTLFILIFSADFVKLLFSEAWLPMIMLIQFLCIWGSIRAISSVRGPLQRGMGMPKINTIINLLMTIVIYSLIFPFSYYLGVNGVAIVIVIAALVANPIGFIISNKLIKLKFKQYIMHLIYPAILSIVVAVIIIGFKMLFLPAVNLINLAILVLFAIFLYAGLGFLLEKVTSFKFLKLIIEIKNIILSKPQIQAN